MRAFVCRQHGAPSVLAFEPVVQQELRPGYVRIDVHAADIGFQDVLMVAGKYQVKPPFPFVPGNIAAGRISACRDGASGFAVGDRVVAVMPYGAYCEEVLVPAGSAVKLPDAVAFDEAAVLAMAHATAYQGLVDRARLAKGEVLLVRGAGSGVGLAAVELGRACGATVIATASSKERLDAAAAAGADHLIDARTLDVRDRVMAITHGRGADVIFDTIGAGFKDTCLRAIARRGRILIVGFAGGEIPQIPANYLLIKFCSVLGVGWGYSVLETEPAHYQEVLASVLNLRVEGRIRRPQINRHSPDGAIGALTALANRTAAGRNVIVFDKGNAAA